MPDGGPVVFNMLQDIQQNDRIGDLVRQRTLCQVKLQKRNIRKGLRQSLQCSTYVVGSDDSGLGKLGSQTLYHEAGRTPDIDDGGLRLFKTSLDLFHGVPARSDVNVVVLAAGVLMKLGEFITPTRSAQTIRQYRCWGAIDRKTPSSPDWELR